MFVSTRIIIAMAASVASGSKTATASSAAAVVIESRGSHEVSLLHEAPSSP